MPGFGVKSVRSRSTFAKKVEMPPGAAELAVGRDLNPIDACLCTTFSDLHVLGLAQLLGGNLALLQLRARLLDAR